MSSNLSGLQNKEERIEVVPSFPACSKPERIASALVAAKSLGTSASQKARGRLSVTRPAQRGRKES